MSNISAQCVSRCRSIGEVEHSTESLAPTHDSIIRRNARGRSNQLLTQTLVIAFHVVMVEVLRQRAAQVADWAHTDGGDSRPLE